MAFHVAFSKYQTASQAIIAFDQVLYNSGNGWNESIYKFVAPVRGLYYFTLTSLNNRRNQAWTSIRVDGRITQRTFAVDDAHGNSGTASVVVELNQDQHVSANLDRGEMHGNSWTHFVGFLIHAA